MPSRVVGRMGCRPNENWMSQNYRKFLRHPIFYQDICDRRLFKNSLQRWPAYCKGIIYNVLCVLLFAFPFVGHFRFVAAFVEVAIESVVAEG